MGNGVFAAPISSRALTSWLRSNGWTREGAIGDHEIYKHDASGVRVQIVQGGHWSKEVPFKAIKAVADAMGLKKNDVIRAVR